LAEGWSTFSQEHVLIVFSIFSRKEKKKVKASSNFMTSWLSKGKRKSTDNVTDLAKEEGVSAEKRAKAEGQQEGEGTKEPMDL
jgi:ribosomal protein S16